MTRLSGMRNICAAFLLCTATAILTSAQTVTTLVEFNGDNGATPDLMTLAQGIDGNLYGTTSSSYPPYYGTIFSMTPAGSLTPLYGFLCNYSKCPYGGDATSGLILGKGSFFYGTTRISGPSELNQCNELGCGTIFKISANGHLTTLHNFEVSDGGDPNSLAQAADGNLYGTTNVGGTKGGGTFFKISGDGRFTTLYNFGKSTLPSGVIQATDEEFYGTTGVGGIHCDPSGCGTVFKINASGRGTLLYKFCSQQNCTDGAIPSGSLIQAVDGNFYGPTYQGGANNYGTVFKMTPTGTLVTLYSFCSKPECADGANPYGPLLQATDGNLYGMTNFGGDTTCSSYGCGTIFQITPSGALTTLYNFESWDSDSGGALFQATNGLLYGATYSGGNVNCGCGTIFSLDMGLGPFVAFLRNSAKGGQEFGILGQGFTGTTAVLLNGIPASFTVTSDTLLTATVPGGATTGYVTVTTPSGMLTSNVPFHVLP